MPPSLEQFVTVAIEKKYTGILSPSKVEEGGEAGFENSLGVIKQLPLDSSDSPTDDS